MPDRDIAIAVFAVEFDFAAKADRVISAAEAVDAIHAGRFCWLDIEATADRPAAHSLLKAIGFNDLAIEEALGPDADGRYDAYDDCLHVAVTSGRFEGETFAHSHVDILIGEWCLVTLRRGPVPFIDHIRRQYRQDFIKFAKTPSFMVFEIWDTLIESYRKSIRMVSQLVESIHGEIFGEVDDRIFNRVSSITRDLLAFRKIMMAAREVLDQMATRHSPFITSGSQPFLTRLADTLGRLCSDLAVEREILAETLNLYMGIVSHRTNKVVNRLTVLSTIFLPLTFLCGVYGMNFEGIPELSWRHGYVWFWALSLTITGTLLVVMRRKRWL